VNADVVDSTREEEAQMNRLASIAAAAMWVLGSATVFPAGSGETPEAQLVGTVLAEPAPAPEFTLTDQHGAAFRMAETRGKVVVLTFIYTHCTDVCPFVALKLKEARALLGRAADRLAILAVTTDPARDTPGVIAAYSQEVGLFDAWHFMTGPLVDVQAVWDAYRIGVSAEGEATADAAEVDRRDGGDEPSQGLSEEDRRLARRIIGQFGGGYEVSHTAPFWLIDRAGRLRAILDADASPQDIATDARILMQER
jgi:protein SCO1/2